MPKQRNAEEREVTRKETVRHRRDVEMNRRVMMGLVGVVVLLVALLAAGLAQELYFRPRQPVATVNGTNIAAQDYAKRVRFSWFQQGNRVDDPQGSSVQVLDQMVDEELIREQAQQRSITVSTEEVDQAIEESFGYQRTPPTPAPTATTAPSPTPGGAPTATPFPTSTPVTLEGYQAAYKTYLDQLTQQASINDQEFRKIVEISLLERKLYDQVSADVPKTEEQLHVQHILVSIRTPEPTPAPTATGQPAPTALPAGAPTPAPTPTPLAPRDESQALARIIEVQQKLGSGTDFGELAKEYSDDTGSVEKGGDLGWIGKGQGLVQEFEDAAFALQPGQVSNPVKTEFGYHLIKVLERDPAHPLDEYTLQQRQYQAYQAWLETIRQQASITRNWTADRVPPTPSVAAQQ